MTASKTALASSPWAGDALTLRSPPHNFEAEIQMLGAILANNRAFGFVEDFLRFEHFADDRHQRIFEACSKLIGRGQLASATTLKNYFEQDSSLADIGGVQYLAKLAGAAVTIINSREHGELIYDLYLRRQLIGLGEEMVNRAYAHDLETGAKEQIEQAETQLFSLSDGRGSEQNIVSLGNAAKVAIEQADFAAKRVDGLVGITTGFDRIDGMTGGLEGGNMYILGGRPSMGKTALASWMMYGTARAGNRALMFSGEMSAAQIGRRIASALCALDLMAVKTGKLDQNDWSRLLECERSLHELPFIIDDRARPTAAQIRSTARRAKARGGLGLIVVDHLTIMGRDRELSQRANTVEIVGRNSGLMKALAKELDVPVLVLAQLSRANEQRDEKRPQLSDLRWAGEIEQDADAVMFVHREHYYLERSKPSRKLGESGEKYADRLDAWDLACREASGKAEVIFAKQRDGAIGSVELLFVDRLARFQNLTRGDK